MALAISRMMVTAILREPLRSQSALVRNAFGHSGVAPHNSAFFSARAPLGLSGELASPPTATCSSTDLSWRFACRCRTCSPTANRKNRQRPAFVRCQPQAATPTSAVRAL